MNIGIRMHDMAAGTIEERALMAKQQGFTCVHLALSKTISPKYMEPAVVTPGLAKHLNEMLNGVDVAVLGCYLNLAHPDEQKYQEILRKYVAHLQLCRWMGAGVVGTETGNPNAEYRYDPVASHTEAALSLFIDRLRPVVEAAEKIGATMAIEPVYTHIVSDGKRARKVLDAIHSPNLKIIFDPVNLLHPDNVMRRDAVIDEAIDLLGDEIAVVHMKDYHATPDALVACAPGLGEMNYDAVLRYCIEHKPYVQMTLEDTKPDNAEQARLFLEKRAEALL